MSFRLYGWSGVSLLLLLLAARDWLSPQAPPFVGRHAPVHAFMFEHFGRSGMPLLFCVLAVAAGIAAWRAWRAIKLSR